MSKDLTSTIVEKVLKKLGIKSEEYLTPSERGIVDVIKDVLSTYPKIIHCFEREHSNPEIGDEFYALGYCPFIKSHLVMSKGVRTWEGEKMTKLINAEMLIKAAEYEAEAMDEPFKSNFAVYVEWLVDKQPPVQPEPSQMAREIATIIENEKDMRVIAKNEQPEIIRCKDCKFYTDMRPDIDVGICSLASRHLGAEGFCSEAERRNGGNEC